MTYYFYVGGAKALIPAPAVDAGLCTAEALEGLLAECLLEG